MSSNTRVFEMVSFSPIGFKIVNYPVSYCPLCRGYLTELCNICIENENENCDVINNDGTYYHNHCYKFMNSKSTVPKKKKKYSSASENDGPVVEEVDSESSQDLTPVQESFIKDLQFKDNSESTD